MQPPQIGCLLPRHRLPFGSGLNAAHRGTQSLARQWGDRRCRCLIEVCSLFWRVDPMIIKVTRFDGNARIFFCRFYSMFWLICSTRIATTSKWAAVVGLTYWGSGAASCHQCGLVARWYTYHLTARMGIGRDSRHKHYKTGGRSKVPQFAVISRGAGCEVVQILESGKLASRYETGCGCGCCGCCGCGCGWGWGWGCGCGFGCGCGCVCGCGCGCGWCCCCCSCSCSCWGSVALARNATAVTHTKT